MATQTTKSVILKFMDNLGDNFNVTLSKVKDLTDSTGKTLVNNAMDAMLTNQPYTHALAQKVNAQQRTVTLVDIEMG